VGVLWGWLLAQGVHIHFAHRTFSWSNEAQRQGRGALRDRRLRPARPAGKTSSTNTPTSKASRWPCRRRTSTPIWSTRRMWCCHGAASRFAQCPEIGIGNKPIDGGNYLFTTEERDAFIAKEPASAKWFRRWLGADEFLNGYERWCLWLGDCPPARAARHARGDEARAGGQGLAAEASKSAPTQKLAATPTRFPCREHADRAVSGAARGVVGTPRVRALSGSNSPKRCAVIWCQGRAPCVAAALRHPLQHHAQRLGARRLRPAGEPLPLLRRHRLQQLPLALLRQKIQSKIRL
jgi:hypothetical protein